VKIQCTLLVITLLLGGIALGSVGDSAGFACLLGLLLLVLLARGNGLAEQGKEVGVFDLVLRLGQTLVRGRDGDLGLAAGEHEDSVLVLGNKFAWIGDVFTF